MRQFILVAILMGSAASGQVEPTLDAEDARVGTVAPAPNQNIRLRLSTGASLNLLFSPGERVEAVSVGDTGAFQVTVPPLADNLLVRATRSNANSMMAVRTSVRSYDFMISTAVGTPGPYVVKIQPENSTQQIEADRGSLPQPTFADPGRYKVSGSKELRPTAISDDGLRTYIEWGASQAIPAVFALDNLGREEMVNGFMRNGFFTIDRVHPRLVFRIDRAKANATRIVAKRGKS
jgi:type IV secretion system protein VirB9